jgi:hypothetical protein
MHPSPMLPQFYSYPPSGESSVYLLQNPVIMGGRPEQQDGAFQKYLSMAVEALKAVATIVGACVQQ